MRRSFGEIHGQFLFLTSGSGVDTVKPLLEEINMNFCKTILAASIAAASVSTVMAAEKMPEKPAVPTLGQVMEATGISVNGYIDTSYTYLEGTGTFTPTPGTFAAGGFNRVFDTERRSFNIHALDLTL